jgi:hypothetical protein
MSIGEVRGALNAALVEDKSGVENVFQIVKNSALEENTNGTTIGGNFIQVMLKRLQIPERMKLVTH